ncbi:MAG: hypothetical protein PHX08_24580, partial [Lachnospiraceae bacterium]|nr:hypothetical protein [Lachnospiraceae bacterium]
YYKRSTSRIIEVLKKNWYIFAYCLLRIIANFYYVFQYSDARISILSIIIEEFFLIVFIVINIATEHEKLKALLAWVYGSSFVFGIGILESLLGFRTINVINTISRDIVQPAYYRLGILRAESTFVLPNFLGMYCVVLFPIICYCYMETKRKTIFLALVLDVFATIFSGCRSDIFILFILICYYAIFKGTKEKMQYRDVMKKLIIVVCIVIIVSSCLSSRLWHYYLGTGKAVLNEVGFNFTLDESNDEQGIEFGDNAERAIYSRTFQLTGVNWVANRNVVFGLGANALTRGVIQYEFDGRWKVATTCDIGYLGVFEEEGCMGLLAYFVLALGVMISYIKKWKRNHVEGCQKCITVSLITYVVCQLVTDRMDSLLWMLMAFYVESNSSLEACTMDLE